MRMKNKKTGTSFVTTKNRVNDQNKKLKLKRYDKKTKKHEEFEEQKL